MTLTSRAPAQPGRCARSVVIARAAFSLVILISPANAQDQVGATFDVWHTLCDAALNCAAYTYSGTGENPKSGRVFNLDRSADTDAWTMSLWLDGVQPNANLGLQASVIRYGRDNDPIPHFASNDLFVQRDQADPSAPGSYVLFLSGSNAQTVMQHLRPGDILDFEFGGCEDEFLYATFSLDGVTAALAWVDAQQSQLPSSSVANRHPNAGNSVRSSECQD